MTSKVVQIFLNTSLKYIITFSVDPHVSKQGLVFFLFFFFWLSKSLCYGYLKIIIKVVCFFQEKCSSRAGRVFQKQPLYLHEVSSAYILPFSYPTKILLGMLSPSLLLLREVFFLFLCKVKHTFNN